MWNSTQRIEQNRRKFNECKRFLRGCKTDKRKDGLRIIESDRELWLPFHQIGNGLAVVDSVMHGVVGQYKEEHEGVIFAYGNVHLPESASASGVVGGVPVLNSEPILPLKFKCDLIVFQPKVDEEYTAVIIEVSEQTVAAMVHGLFSCNVRCKNKNKLVPGDSIRVKVTAVRVHKHIIQLHADLVKQTDPNPLPVSPFTPHANGRRLFDRSRLSDSSPLNLSAVFTPSAQKTPILTRDNPVNSRKLFTSSGEEQSGEPRPGTSATGMPSTAKKHKKSKKHRQRERSRSGSISEQESRRKGRKRKRSESASACETIVTLDETNNNNNNDPLSEEGHKSGKKHKKKKKHKRMKLDDG